MSENLALKTSLTSDFWRKKYTNRFFIKNMWQKYKIHGIMKLV